ncbi:hypothetical protein MNBD_GAMMA12-1138, partial [hydrothermal vent metagenome]
MTTKSNKISFLKLSLVLVTLQIIFWTEILAATTATTASIITAADRDLSPSKSLIGLVNVKDHIPTVIVEARYNTVWNFTGTVIPGYKGNVCLLS